jgi:hypothetical protein
MGITKCKGCDLINHINQLNDNKKIDVTINVTYTQVKDINNKKHLNNIINIEKYGDINKQNIEKTLWLCELNINNKIYHSISNKKKTAYNLILTNINDELLSYL